MTRPARLLLIATLVAAFSVPVALADNVGWSELSKHGHVTVMRYRVSSLTFGKTSWTARIAFSNLSDRTIKVGSRFGLAFYAGQKLTKTTIGFAYATTYSARLPSTLRPGETWSGVIGGSGSLTAPTRVYVRLVFGPFSGLPGEKGSVFWVTDHALPVGHTVAPKDVGPAI